MVTPVSVGNLHAVAFVENITDAPVDTVGKELEHHSYFKDGVNAEFVQVIDRVPSKCADGSAGSGACATGACAWLQQQSWQIYVIRIRK